MSYAIIVSIISILLGTIPIGYDAWPNIIGILIGAGLVVLFAFFVCAPVLSPTGRFDLLTELTMMCKRSEEGETSELLKLKEDTVKAYNGEEVEADVKAVDASDDSEKVGLSDEKEAAVEEETETPPEVEA